MVLIIFLYAILAGTFSLGKLILNYTQPIFLVGIRMSIAGILLLGYQWFANKAHFTIKKEDWFAYVQVVLFTIYIPYILRYWGLTHVTSSKACLIYNFGPFVTLLLSYYLCAEKITVKKVGGMVIGFLGLLPIVLKGGSCPTLFGTSLFLAPELAILGATASSSYGWLVVHRLIKQGYSPFFTNGIGMTCGGLLALFTSFFVEWHTGFVSDFSSFLSILVVIILVSNLLGHNLYALLLKKYSPTLVSFGSFVAPFFTALYGWLFLEETITWTFVASSIIVFFGLMLFYQDELSNGNSALNKPTTPLDKTQQIS